MNERDEAPQFFEPDALDRDHLHIEIPPETPPPPLETIPNGYDPMGDIYLRGRAYRGLASGSGPWWVLIAGWLIFGGAALLILTIAIVAQAFELIGLLMIAVIPFVIVWRGTVAKRAAVKRRRQSAQRSSAARSPR
jgi:hypothetical protein